MDNSVASPSLPDPATATIPSFWRMTAQTNCDLTAVRRNGVGMTFGELDARSTAVACGLLAVGAGKGARIGLMMANGPEWIVCWLAITRIGAIAVTLSTFFVSRELTYTIRHADVAILLSDERFLRHDYVARLEEAFPGLAAANGRLPLALPECPFLRSIWFTTEIDRAWRGGSLRDLEARGEAAGVGNPAMLAAVEEAVAPSDLAMVIYTSGSTADPKGIVHTHAATVNKTLFLARANGLIPANVERGDRLIVTYPFFWIGGFVMLAGALAHGASVICVDEHTPQALLETLRSEQATHLGASEAVLGSIRSSPWFQEGDFDRLKPVNTNQRPIFMRNAVARKLITRSLGMTETFGPHSGDPRGALLPPDAAGSLGRALEGVEYKIVDPVTRAPTPFGEPGELCVRTPWLMAAMYKKEWGEAFDVDGYYPTGDQCILREDGYLFYVSRLGAMIKTSGSNVSPDEVEQVIVADPDVVEAAVLGLPDAELGQIVVAAVVKRNGSELDENMLKVKLRTQLSSFKVPKRIFFFDFDELPRTPSNKIRKPALAEIMVSSRMSGGAD